MMSKLNIQSIFACGLGVAICEIKCPSRLSYQQRTESFSQSFSNKHQDELDNNEKGSYFLSYDGKQCSPVITNQA